MLPPHLRGTATGLLQCLRWSKADVEYLDQKRYDSAVRRARAEQAVRGARVRRTSGARGAHEQNKRCKARHSARRHLLELPTGEVTTMSTPWCSPSTAAATTNRER